MNLMNNPMIYHWCIRYNDPDDTEKLILSYFTYDFPKDDNGTVKDGTYNPPEFTSETVKNYITYKNGKVVEYLCITINSEFCIDFSNNEYTLINSNKKQIGKLIDKDVDGVTKLVTSITYSIDVQVEEIQVIERF